MPDGLPLREAVARAVLGRLRAALAPVPVERNRRSMVHASEAPVVNFWDAGHTADIRDYGETAYSMNVPIEATVAAETDDALGPAVNDLYVRTLGALMAEPTLGGLCQQLTEAAVDVRIAPVEESDAPLAFLSLDVVAEFHAADGSPMPWQDAVPALLPGDAGEAASTTGSKYRHIQAEPSATWVIRHNLDHYPNYVVVDTAGNRIHPGGESYPDNNTLVLGFGVPFAGTADLD